MNLSDLMALKDAVTGATFALAAEDHLTLVRDEDGVTVDVRAVAATALDPKDREGDAILVVRWQEPVARDLETLSSINADAAISVATAHRYENLYGESTMTFFRAQLLGTGLEPSRFLEALAHDLGLADSLELPPPVTLDQVGERLSSAPVPTPEEGLLLAIFGKESPDPGKHYHRTGDVLEGPSSVGESTGSSPPVDVEIRVDELGLVRVRHERAVSDEADVLGKLDASNAESSSDESLVHYHRAFRCDESRVAVEFTTTFRELGTRTYVRKLRGLEIAASTHFS